MSAEDKDHEQASLMGRAAKTEEPTAWESYVGYLREFLLYYRPQAIVTLTMTVLFSAAWGVAYGWGIAIWQGIHKDCTRPLYTYLGGQGVIGILTLAAIIAVAAYAFKLTYGTRPSKMPDCPQAFIGLFTFTLVMLVLNFTWFVVGTAWMFELGGRTTQHKTPTCNEQLYLFTWWYITAGWMWYIVIAIVGCALSACLPVPKRVDGHLQKGLGGDKP